ncbi:cyclin-J18-like [Iris pallida]|uniref:Cyclin-J18-like n=1 Tax=Iris pallida TaxID=29817 RepID=A0AAX6F6H7_IRIPA|nr:cyclin-J18-like [Iris pallida]
MEKYPSLLLPRDLRHDLLEFHFHSSHQLQVPPVVKYTALFLFAERFLPILKRSGSGNKHWLVKPPRESNLQLFVLISIWVSSKVIHGSRPLSVKSLKSLGDRIIGDQHFTTRDFAEAELVFMEVLRFEIGASNICFVFLEDLLTHFRCSTAMSLIYKACELLGLITLTFWPKGGKVIVGK